MTDDERGFYNWKKVLDSGVDPNIDYGHYNLFIFIIHISKITNPQLIQLFIERGADVNSKDDDGYTALMAAIPSIELMKLLIDNGADANAEDEGGLSVLMWACKKGHIESVKLLIEAKSNIHFRNKHGWTPLMVACEGGHKEIFKLLLQYGASEEGANNETS